jgi:hypothetical protein
MPQNDSSPLPQSDSAGNGLQVFVPSVSEVQDWCKPRVRERSGEVEEETRGEETWKDTQLGRKMEVRVIAVAVRSRGGQ